ncbi:MAG: hypothetical protein ACREQQ_05930 [Candidatus Binatia bacterium]
MVLGLMMGISACGGGGGGSENGAQSAATESLMSSGASEIASSALCGLGGPLPADLMAVYDETEQCTGLSAPPPRVVFSPTVPCPASGQMHCLVTVAPFPCSSDPSRLCGAAGRYLASCDTIELPDAYSGAAAHEMIHHLMRHSGRGDWTQHGSPEWSCQ